MLGERGKFTICKETGKLVPYVKKQIDADAPFVQIDTMEPLKNHSDRKYYTSKKEFRAANKRMGRIEIGNEKIPIQKPKTEYDEVERRLLRDDIERCYYGLKNGTIEITEEQRARCKEYDELIAWKERNGK